jgi:hypothetical protein
VQLTVLGSAAAWSESRCRPSSSYLIEDGEAALVLDLGQGSLSALFEHRDPSSVTGFAISHMHADHHVDLVPLRNLLRFGYPEPRSVGLLAPHELRDRYDAFLGEDDFLDLLRGPDLTAGDHEIGPFGLQAHPVTHSERSHAFRVTIQEKVERKTPGGEWEEILVVKDPSQAEQAYRDQTQTTNLSFLPGPLDAVIDPVSGNLLLAMGGEGVMIIKPDGQQVWVAVGDYRHGGLRQDGIVGIVNLLSLEFLLALLAGVAWWLTATLRYDRTRWQTAWVVIAWIGVALAVFLAHPDFVSGYFAAITMLGVLVLGIYLAVIVIARIIRVTRKKSGGLLLPLAGIPVIMILFILPFVLWGLNILPEFLLAALVAGVLIAAGGVPLARWLAKEN